MFLFDKFLEPVVVVLVSHTRKNYFDWALSDWAIKANVWVLTFGPLCILYIRTIFNWHHGMNFNTMFRKNHKRFKTATFLTENLEILGIDLKTT